MAAVYRSEGVSLGVGGAGHPSRPRIAFPRHPREMERRDQWFVRKRIGVTKHPLAKVVRQCAQNIFLPDRGREPSHIVFRKHFVVKKELATFVREPIGKEGSYKYNGKDLWRLFMISDSPNEMPQDLTEEEYIDLLELIQHANPALHYKFMQKFSDFGYYKRLPKELKLKDFEWHILLDPTVTSSQIEHAIETIVQEKRAPKSFFEALNRVAWVSALNEKDEAIQRSVFEEIGGITFFDHNLIKMVCDYYFCKIDRIRFVKQIFFAGDLSKFNLAGPLLGLEDRTYFDHSLQTYSPTVWNFNLQFCERIIFNKVITHSPFFSKSEREELFMWGEGHENPFRMGVSFDKAFKEPYQKGCQQFCTVFCESDYLSLECAEQAMKYMIDHRYTSLFTPLLEFHVRGGIYLSKALQSYLQDDIITLVKKYAIYTRVDYAKRMLPCTFIDHRNHESFVARHVELDAGLLLGLPEKLDTILSLRFQFRGLEADYEKNGKLLVEEELVVAAMNSSIRLSSRQKEQLLLDFNEARRAIGRHVLPLKSEKGEISLLEEKEE